MMSRKMVSMAAMAAVLAVFAAEASAQRGGGGRGMPSGPAAPPTPEAIAATQAALDAPRVQPGYVVPRLAIGQPDLGGVWSNASNTTMSRPTQFKSLIMTDEEAAKARAANPSNIRQATDDNQKTSDGLLDGKDLAAGRGYNAFWIDPGNNYANVKGTWRTSWIVDPPTGAVPFSESGRKLLASMGGARARGTGYDNPEERGAGERCIVGFGGTGGPPMMNVLYNNNIRFVQSPDAVVILVEMNHDARVVKLKGQHGPQALNRYLGDSVGWWEGDTLVVETVNINPEGGSQVRLTPGGKIVERFTRYNENQVLYEFEVHDPALYTQVWKGQIGLNKSPELYEYACHEGNYGLHGILEGGRAADRKGKDIREAGDRDEG